MVRNAELACLQKMKDFFNSDEVNLTPVRQIKVAHMSLPPFNFCKQFVPAFPHANNKNNSNPIAINQ
jgi:hypothetical protein